MRLYIAFEQYKKKAPRTGCREYGVEADFAGPVLAVSTADAVVAARHEDSDATQAELREQITRANR